MLKLASSEYFKLFMMNQRPDGSYILKEVNFEGDLPSWNTLASGVLYDEAMRITRECKSEGLFPLLCSNRFNSFDLREISNRGFTIWRESSEEEFYIEQYEPKKLRWSCLKTFKNLQERTEFINHQLLNPYVVIVD